MMSYTIDLILTTSEGFLVTMCGIHAADSLGKGDKMHILW